MQAECANLREELASKDEHLSAEAASNLAHAQEIIMLKEEVGRLKVSVRMRACLLSITGSVLEKVMSQLLSE